MLKEYFKLTQSQSKAVLILMTLILASVVFYFFMPMLFHPQKEESTDKEFENLIAQIQLDSNQNTYASSYETKNEKSSKLTPFKFNPNTLDSAGFKRLGLRDKLIHTILNYRNKGGKFYNNESLKRIYGLHEDEYVQLESFIDIPNTFSNYSKNESKPQINVELNSADTGQLVQLRMIGSKLAMNIVKYREQIGGFARVEQVKEVYGIREETYQIIKPNIRVNANAIKKLNLNVATFNELNAHPYLKGELAKAITDYRKQHDYHIENISQLKEIELINDEIYRKIAPYLSIQ